MLGVTADRQEDARGVRADTTPLYVKCKVLKELSQPPPALSLAKSLDTTPTSLDPGAPSFTPTVSTNALSPDERKTVLLQTARSIVYNPSNPTASIEVRLLFDTGSQKSYITERPGVYCHGTLWRTTSLHCHFWISQGTNEGMPNCRCGNAFKNCSPMSFMLYVVPTICGPLVSQPITTCIEQNPKFLGLDIAQMGLPVGTLTCL